MRNARSEKGTQPARSELSEYTAGSEISSYLELICISLQLGNGEKVGEARGTSDTEGLHEWSVGEEFPIPEWLLHFQLRFRSIGPKIYPDSSV